MTWELMSVFIIHLPMRVDPLPSPVHRQYLLVFSVRFFLFHPFNQDSRPINPITLNKFLDWLLF
jgi:hypothetical protein